MKKRLISALLVLCVLLSMGTAAMAVDNSLHYDFILEASDHTQQVKTEIDEVFTIDFILRCTSISADETFTLYAMQNEVVYDKDMLYLEDAELLENFGNNSLQITTRDLLSREGNFQRIMINAGTSSVGSTYAPVLHVARLTFRALMDGVTFVSNENANMSIASAMDDYASTVYDVTVTIGSTEEPEPDTYAISITNPTGGTITTTPTGSVTAGTNVSLGIALDADYSLARWSVTAADGTSVTVSNVALVNGASFVMPSQAVTVTAALNYNGGNSTGGSGSGSGGGGSSTSDREITIDDDETPLAAPDIPRFDDVPPSHWAYVYVEYLAELGFVNGKTETMYYPGDNITRGEFITILARMSGENMPVYNGEFADVAAERFYAGPVAWGYANGIVKGTSATAFSPDDKISRQDIAVMIARYAEYKGYSFGKTNDAAVFTDSAGIAGYASEAVTAMQQANIINGYEDGSFMPKGNATRAEGAKMLALIHHAMYPDLLTDYYN